MKHAELLQMFGVFFDIGPELVFVGKGSSIGTEI